MRIQIPTGILVDKRPTPILLVRLTHKRSMPSCVAWIPLTALPDEVVRLISAVWHQLFMLCIHVVPVKCPCAPSLTAIDTRLPIRVVSMLVVRLALQSPNGPSVHWLFDNVSRHPSCAFTVL